LDEAATRRKKITNSHFEKMSLWERLSSREKPWQNASCPISGNELDLIMRITDKNLAICKKIAED
jgi:hypothetical protein